MAKNIGYNRSTVEKFNVKGFLSEDQLTVTYVEGKGDDAHEVEALVSDFMKPFAGEDIELTIVKKMVEELKVPYTEDELVLE